MKFRALSAAPPVSTTTESRKAPGHFPAATRTAIYAGPGAIGKNLAQQFPIALASRP